MQTMDQAYQNGAYIAGADAYPPRWMAAAQSFRDSLGVRAVLDQLLAILTDMRQTVRPEQNLPVRIEAFSAQDMAESIRTAFYSMAQARGISIELRMGAGANHLRCTDRVRLNQTLSNLVKNALIHAG